MIIVTEKAYAKLNLCLSVGETLSNGYHAVESLMQSISLHDTVRLEKSERISLSCEKSYLPTDGRNLAYKAAELFFETNGVKGGVGISLIKRIPVCAGLGGGSADAAAVLRGLNRLYGNPYSHKDLVALSASLGADVPFCVECGTAFATGVGDIISPLPHTNLYYVLIFDKTPLSTPKMYAALDAGAKTPADAKACLAAVLAGNREKAASLAANSFLAVAKEACPQIEANVALLTANGAIAATVTGKGPTVFGVFTDKAAALSCATAVRGTYAESVSGV